MHKVLITPASLANLDGPYRGVLRAAGFDMQFQTKGEQLSEAELLEILPGFSAVIAGSEPYTVRVFERCPELRVIARAGVGYDSVDVAAASARGIAVTITPGANHDSAAEHAFALILALAKRVVACDTEVKQGLWKRAPTIPLRGQTLGIVGLGRIGKATALRGLAFKMRVIAHEPVPDLDFARNHGIDLVPLERLLAESDFVTLHLPLTEATRRLIRRETLAGMKPQAMLINTARGGLVDEADLYEALASGRLGGAALDVFDQEPPGLVPLLTLPNVVATPHLAGIDRQATLDMALMAAETIVALGRGDWPAERIVNPECRGRWCPPTGRPLQSAATT
jgi:D-3-phosphoglycerate dehydrogenase